MFIVDRELERLKRAGTRSGWEWWAPGSWPEASRVGMLHYTKGMELAAISNRHLEGARATPLIGREQCHTCALLGRAGRLHRPRPARDHRRSKCLCNANGIDAILEVPG